MFPKMNRQPMSLRLLLILLLAPTTLALVACDSATEPEEDQMTQDEVNAFMQGLYGGNLLVYGETLLQADPTALTVIPPGVPFPLDATIPCSGGGEAAFSGNATFSANEAQGSLTAELSGTLAAAGCTFTGDNVTFALDSDPGLAQTGTVIISLETFSLSLDVVSSGAFSWTSGTRSGSCDLDNDITARISLMDAALSGAVPTATVSGSVCGLTVNREITMTATTS